MPRAATKAATTQAAKKTAKPAARTRRAAPEPAEETVDLLDGLQDETAPVEDDDESFDLLDDLQEDNGTPWMPWVEEDQPEGIQGRVTYVGTVLADEAYGGGEKPLIELTDTEGNEWSVRGYATVLKNQIEKCDPQVGDIFAVKYFGEKEPRGGGKAYHNFKCAVRRANA